MIDGRIQSRITGIVGIDIGVPAEWINCPETWSVNSFRIVQIKGVIVIGFVG